MSLRWILVSALAVGFAGLAGCSCGEAANDLLDGGAVGADGAISSGEDGATGGPGDGAISGNGDGASSGNGDGAMSGGGDGASSGNGDGAIGDASPLEQGLAQFCAGSGSVVTVGTGDLCTGQLAENTFRFALCTCEDIAIQSTLTLDGFDSRLGPYGAVVPGGGINVIDDGQLGTNAPLRMDGKLEVHGSAFVGEGFSVGAQSEVAHTLYSAGTATQSNSSSSVGRNAYVRGDVVGRYSVGGNLYVPVGADVSRATQVAGQTVRGPVPRVLPCACGADQLLDIGAITAYGRTHNDNVVRGVLTATTWSAPGGPRRVVLPCGRYYVSGISTGALEIHAEGRVVLFVDGDMTIDGSLRISTASTAELDLFVAGELSVRASADLGSQDRPAAVRTYVGGSDDIRLAASTVFGGFVYAPRARVIFGASAELFGGLFARRVDMSGAARIHYDNAVRSAGAPCGDGGVDGGVRGDGGAPADGGPSPADGGPSSMDGGPGMPDARPADAGPPPSGCACQAQCGPQACVMGQCVACQTDLDCCAPLACRAGLCGFDF